MDFWDLTKLLFRRWYVTAPLLVVTVLIGGWTYTSVEPDYKAVSYVQLIPPPTPTTKDAQIRNPWVELGLGSLNTAATYATADSSFLGQLKGMGLSDNVVIDTGYPAPIATITVIASSKSQAVNTVDAVVRHFEETVKGLQDAYGVQQASLIDTRRLDTGKNLEETGGKVKRALIAVLGAGIIITVGVTVGFDAIARRLARRRSRNAAAPDDEASDDSVEQLREPHPQDVDHRMPRAGSRGRSNVPIRMNRTAEETIILQRPQLDRTRDRKAGGEVPPIVRQRATVNGSAEDDDGSSDRTMVLPRAGSDSAGRDGGGRRA